MNKENVNRRKTGYILLMFLVLSSVILPTVNSQGNGSDRETFNFIAYGDTRADDLR